MDGWLTHEAARLENAPSARQFESAWPAVFFGAAGPCSHKAAFERASPAAVAGAVVTALGVRARASSSASTGSTSKGTGVVKASVSASAIARRKRRLTGASKAGRTSRRTSRIRNCSKADSVPGSGDGRNPGPDVSVDSGANVFVTLVDRVLMGFVVLWVWSGGQKAKAPAVRRPWGL